MKPLSIIRNALLVFALAFLPIFAQATPAIVQQKNASAQNAAVTTNTVSFALTSPVTSGNDVAIAFTYGAGAGTPSISSITDDKGNTYTIDQNVNNPLSGSFMLTAHALNVTNAPQTISVTEVSTASGAMGGGGTVYEISGATAIDVNTTCEPSSCGSSSTSWIASFTTASASEIGIIVNTQDAVVTLTQNNGWTQDSTENGFTAGSTFHNTLTSAGANSLNATASASTHNGWVVLTFSGTATPTTSTVVFNQAGFAPAIISTVSALPTCNAALKGGKASVSDATSPTYNAALTGGGTVSVPVYCNGSAWTAH
jgi:hypothetical protein